MRVPRLYTWAKMIGVKIMGFLNEIDDYCNKLKATIDKIDKMK